MLINPLMASTGSAPAPTPTFYANNLQVARSTDTSYTTENLSATLPDNTVIVVALFDDTYIEYPVGIIKFNSTSNNTLKFTTPSLRAYTITLTNTTVSLSQYSGDYRDVYVKISNFIGSNSQLYDV